MYIVYIHTYIYIYTHYIIICKKTEQESWSFGEFHKFEMIQKEITFVHKNIRL